MAWSSIFAAGRNASSFTAGAVFGVSVTMIVVIAKVDASTIDALTGSINQLAIAVAALGAAIVPIYTIVKSWWSASPEGQQAAVATRRDRIVLDVEPEHAEEAAIVASTLPQVKAVITNDDIAKKTPAIDKIVGPDAKPATP